MRDAQRLRAMPHPLLAGPAQAVPAELVEISDTLLAGGCHSVYVPPRSGSTTLAVEVIRGALQRGVEASRIAVLAPTRSRAAHVRDALTARALRASAAGGDPPGIPGVFTPLAYAFAVVSRAHAERGRPVPSLVTGAQADAILADILASDPGQWPADMSSEAVHVQGFRTELRDVISRASERGVSPSALAELGRARSRPEWESAAEAYGRYLDVLSLISSSTMDSGELMDAGWLVHQAVAELETREAPELVVVDGAEDLTASGVALVSALARSARAAVVASCPDSAVEGFRGGLADAAERIVKKSGRPWATHAVPSSASVPPALARALAQLRGRLPLAGAPARVRSSRIAGPGEGPGAGPGASTGLEAGRGHAQEADASLDIYVAPHEEAEAQAIATAVRTLSVEHHVSVDDMAVVCRSASAAGALAERLARAGLRVDVALHARALRDEPVVRDIAKIVDIALGAVTPGPEDVVALLRGPFGECDDMQVRGIRRALVEIEARAAGAPSAEEGSDSARLLVRVLFSEAPIVAEGWNDGEGSGGSSGEAASSAAQHRRLRAVLSPLERLRRMRHAVTEHHGSLTATLWALWSTAGLAKAWREAALTDSTPAERARARLMHSRLDSVIALMEAADRYEEREGGEDLEVFLEQIRASAIPEDTLAPRARMSGTLRVSTPAALAGTGVDTVFMAGVNEGAWPNARLRSHVLGATDLALMLDDPDTPTDPAVIRAIQRDAVIADEVRLAVSALSRARSRVLVTAVSDDERQPSALVPLLAEVAGESTWASGLLEQRAPGPYPDARTLVGHLRRDLEVAAVDGSDAADDGNALVEGAAAVQRDARHALLAALANAGLDEADPARWYHRPLSTAQPATPAEARPVLSPSALETADQCVRAYLLEQAGARAGVRETQSLGTIVHALAQEHPTAGATALMAALVEHVDAPGEDSPWHEKAAWERTVAIIDKLGAYQQAHPDVLAVEKAFEADVRGVRIRGSVDRVENEPEGARVVDYKTGKVAKSAKEAETDLQLAAYQHALAASGEYEQMTGASLVYLGTPSASAALRHQPPAAETATPTWFEDKVQEIDASLRARSVTLTRNPHCAVCPVQSSCPLFDEGGQL